MKNKTKSKKSKKQINEGNVYIKATFNNTIISITDSNGEVVSWCSSGQVGFKGAKKGTPFAAQLASESAAKKAVETVGMSKVYVFVNGPGSGRETSIRALQASGLEVLMIKDVTPVPHNGCRPQKKRRV